MNIVTKVPTHITVRRLRQWLESLPEEFQDAPFESLHGSFPVALKRIVAYSYINNPDHRGVVANSMGSHLPFDDSLTWHFTLAP